MGSCPGAWSVEGHSKMEANIEGRASGSGPFETACARLAVSLRESRNMSYWLSWFMEGGQVKKNGPCQSRPLLPLHWCSFIPGTQQLEHLCVVTSEPIVCSGGVHGRMERGMACGWIQARTVLSDLALESPSVLDYHPVLATSTGSRTWVSSGSLGVEMHGWG